jgi:flagellar hook protein FlgE
MFNSFSSALSALKAHSTAVDAVGHNLANVNTTGFKSTDVAFKDIVAQSISGGESGMGVGRPISVRNFGQGAIQSTSGILDAAIQGNGFFVVKDGKAEAFTRDGSFQIDQEGYVVTLTGERVQQLENGTLSDIRLPSGATAAVVTQNMTISANLDATAAVGDTFSAPVEVVDSLGIRHKVTVTFTKTAANEWDYSATMPKEDVDPMPTTDPEIGSGSLTFGTDGKMTVPDPLPTPEQITIEDLAGGASDMTINWSLFDANKLPTLTQFGQASAVVETMQDGFASAQMISVGMADGGKIVASYANGQKTTIATLAIALIPNQNSLTAAGNNSFKLGFNSAEPSYGTAEGGGRGKVKAGALEASTVDIAREFTNLIVYQRGYQANSRVITTADEMSQETLNLKR